MAEDCFASLMVLGRRFDEGIKKLTETWRFPQNILGGYGADEKQAENDLQTLKSEITTLKNNLIDDGISRSNYMAEIGRFCKESQQMYDDLVKSCHDLEGVFSEYGYVKEEDKSTSIKMDAECSVNSSLIASDVTDDLLEVEFTPDMTWRHKAKILVS